MYSISQQKKNFTKKVSKQANQFAKSVSKKGVALAAFDKAVALASAPSRQRARKNAKSGRQGNSKRGDQMLGTIASIGRMTLGGAPRGLRKVKRAATGESFAHALADPFSADARGARVPDLYAFPTNTFRLQTSMLMGANSTEFGAVFLPNPYVSALDLGDLGSVASSVTSLGGARRFTGASAFMGLTTPTLFTPLATAFRVVGGGIKIRNLIPELTATGRIYVALFPVASGGVPNYRMLDGVIPSAGYSGILQRMGLPLVSGLRTAALQMQPVSKDFTVGQVVGDEEIEVNFSVYHPDFFRFKPTGATSVAYNSQFAEVDDVAQVLTTTTGLTDPTYSGNKEAMQIDGGSAIVVWIEGVPASANAPFEVDVCLHLECVPLVVAGGTTGSTGITPETDNPPRPVHGSTAMVEAEITEARVNPDNIIRMHHSSKGSGGARIADID